MATSGGHNLTWRPYGKYVKQTSSQEPLDGLEPYLAEMLKCLRPDGRQVMAIVHMTLRVR
jgi:hypothetical protein